MLFQDKVTGNQFFTGIRRHGVDSRQVCDQCIAVPADNTVLAVHGHTGEVADVLVGTCQLVEKGRFAAVLVTDKRKGQFCAIRKRIAAAFGMETSFFTQARVFR